MPPPTLSEPPPPPGKTGWPWAEETKPLPDALPDGKPWPKISIVTPNYNCEQFLKETMRSVLEQEYPNLEYIVIDGDSTDNSVEIIKKYENYLSYWISEPDEGLYDALNKGFLHSDGEIMAWINSDDKYLPWTLQVVAEIFSSRPEIEWITTSYPLSWNSNGVAVDCSYTEGYSQKSFYRGENLPGFNWYAFGYIQQESTFWRRSLWDRAGGYIETAYKLASDFELWARFFKHAELYAVQTPLGGFRFHNAQKTANLIGEYSQEAKDIFDKYGGIPLNRFRSMFHRKIVSLLGRFRTLLIKPGWLIECKVCFYDYRNKGWTVRTIYK